MTDYGIKYGIWMILGGIATAWWPLLASGFCMVLIAMVGKLAKGLYD